MTLTNEEYEALIAMARRGAVSPDHLVALDQFLRQIETNNGIVRHFLLIKWQETDQELPPTAQFPEKWPPELTASIELLSRPVARADVDALLATRASKPAGVYVTKDPSGRVGWATLDQYFIT